MPVLTKAITAHAPGEPWQYEEVELADPAPGQLHIQIVSVGLCHTDIKTGEGKFRIGLPLILGHEGTGYVKSVGPDTTGFAIGDAVVLSFASCGTCLYCRQSMSPYCLKLQHMNFAGQARDGKTVAKTMDGKPIKALFFGQSSLSQIALVDASCAVKVVVRDRHELKKLVLGCAFQTGAGSILNVCQPKVSSDIAVWGCGGVGLAAIMAANLSSPRRIIAIDVQESKLAAAMKYGATHTINATMEDVPVRIRELTDGVGVQYALECVGSAAILATAQKCTAARGTFVTVGGTPFGVEASLSPTLQLGQGLTYRGCHQGDAVPQVFIPKLLELWRDRKFPFDELVSFYPVEEFQQALDDLRDGKVVKPVLVFPDEHATK